YEPAVARLGFILGRIVRAAAPSPIAVPTLLWWLAWTLLPICQLGASRISNYDDLFRHPDPDARNGRDSSGEAVSKRPLWIGTYRRRPSHGDGSLHTFGYRALSSTVVHAI